MHPKLVYKLLRRTHTLLSNISTVSLDECLLVCGDFNEHVGETPEGFNKIHGGCGFDSRNADRIRIFDL